MSKLPTNKLQAERLLKKAINHPEQMSDDEILFLNRMIELAEAFYFDEKEANDGLI